MRLSASLPLLSPRQLTKFDGLANPTYISLHDTSWGMRRECGAGRVRCMGLGLAHAFTMANPNGGGLGARDSQESLGHCNHWCDWSPAPFPTDKCPICELNR